MCRMQVMSMHSRSPLPGHVVLRRLAIPAGGTGRDKAEGQWGRQVGGGAAHASVCAVGLLLRWAMHASSQAKVEPAWLCVQMRSRSTTSSRAGPRHSHSLSLTRSPHCPPLPPASSHLHEHVVCVCVFTTSSGRVRGYLFPPEATKHNLCIGTMDVYAQFRQAERRAGGCKTPQQGSGGSDDDNGR